MKKLISNFIELSTLGKATILVSLFTLVVSFFFPAFYIDRPENPKAWSNSFLLFFLGWTFPLGGAIVPFVFWLANPTYLLAIYLIIKKNIKGLYLSCIAAFLALIFSQLDSIMTSESGSNSKITSLELGFYLWLTSFLILTTGTALNILRKNNNPIRSENQ